jgi:hypothetical protein
LFVPSYYLLEAILEGRFPNFSLLQHTWQSFFFPFLLECCLALLDDAFVLPCHFFLKKGFLVFIPMIVESKAQCR